MRRHKIAVSLILSLSLVFAAGCGDRTREVSGKVTVKGEAAGKVRVILVSAKDDGKSFSGETSDDGSFRIGAVPDGDYKVYFASVPGAGYGAGGYAGQLQEKAKGGGGGGPNPYGRMMPGKGGGAPSVNVDPQARGKAGAAAKEQDRAAKEEGAPSAAGSSVQIPAKYTSHETSGFTWSTKSESSKTFNLE